MGASAWWAVMGGMAAASANVACSRTELSSGEKLPTGGDSGTAFFSGATAVSSGDGSACALLPAGIVECWGDNAFGELGDGTSSGPEMCNGDPCSTKRVTVAGLTGAIAVSTSSASSCALLTGGTVQCWGDNTFGELGDGTSSGPEMCNGDPCSTTPVSVTGLTGATAVSVGGYFACTVVMGGAVQCWGTNWFGELGNGTSTSSTTPVAVTGLTGATAVSAGPWSACGVLTGGTVQCWGANWDGELGNGTAGGPEMCTGDPCSTTPVSVTGLRSATAVSVGVHFACAVLTGGTVQCWGDNQSGELGNGTNTSSTTPVPIPGLTGAIAVSASSGSACALLTGGRVECWGDNSSGVLGDGTSGGPDTCIGGPCSTIPVAVSGVTGASSVSVGFGFACALGGGAVQCWGDNSFGELGNGAAADSGRPMRL